MFPNVPKMCMEMCNGWFDAWGDEKHHTTSADDWRVGLRDYQKQVLLQIMCKVQNTV